MQPYLVAIAITALVLALAVFAFWESLGALRRTEGDPRPDEEPPDHP